MPPESSKFEKCPFSGFLENGPRDPPKRKKSFLRGSLVVLDPNGSPKNFLSIFGTGCHKVCTCLLNGANTQHIPNNLNIILPSGDHCTGRYQQCQQNLYTQQPQLGKCQKYFFLVISICVDTRSRCARVSLYHCI